MKCSKSFTWYLFGVFFTIFSTQSYAVPALLTGRLTCEYMENPLGIDIRKPRLSWTLESVLRNQRQTAYEVLVSDNQKDIAGLKGNVWQTGKVSSDQNLHVEYNGKALSAFKRYYWRVRSYDTNGQPSEWSKIAWFETAMLQPEDWTAQWIGDGSKQFEKDEDFYKNDPMPLFRKSFDTRKKLTAARLYIAGVGYYEAYLNGRKVGDHVLDPGWTSYEKQVLYCVYDVTALLRPGTNVAGVMVGNGFYNPLPLRLFGTFNIRNAQQTGRPAVKAEIRLEYADGSTEKILTDESWQTAPGPVVRNSVYLGEHYDARLEKKGWASDKTVSGWKNASVTNGPSGRLTVQMQPPIRVTKVVKPVSVREVRPGVFVFDMGQNFAGVARISVSGKAGNLIKLRYGEDILKDGSLNVMTTVTGQIKSGRGGPGAPQIAWQEDNYTLKGEGREVWAPRFTFHGFRYVEVTGWEGTPGLNDIEGLRLNADLPQNGNFESSSTLFNKLLDMARWTFLSNVFSVQSDCPAREKLGYGGDIVGTAESFIYSFDMANFYVKAVADFANDQRKEGGITETAPYIGIADRGPKDSGSGPLGWQLAFSFLQKQLYDFYGDKRIIENNYETFKKQVDYLRTQASENFFYRDISDHEALDTKPEAFTASCFYYHHVKLLSEFAGIIDKKEDSVAYGKLAGTIKGAILEKYLVGNSGRFDNGTQSAQIFGLYYSLAPEAQKNAVMKQLESEIARHKGHISTGLFATKMLFNVLSDQNRNDLVYLVMNQREFPGWGYMVDKGATTIWETWAYSDNIYSQNHPMFGSFVEWFYRSLLGINAVSAGFEKIKLKPQPTGDLTFAKGSYQSVRGIISSDWKIENGRFIFKASIPANTRAEIWVPSKEGHEVLESGATTDASKGLRFLRYQDGYAVFDAGSGNFIFTSQL
ncbi:Alpha-L-rhamnosidase [Dyadobacter sp. CECT 9275]|uniref:alpha-L-rhamnosidase n=1 Tax=Dyadobacter helix TaxID=2822344 RepID=A0A916JI78_9BACT|nr:family 78 glycoside hydrolase catalytic domain [Dyadobacter sp. CECT 9275]CAG5017646.1 Alpha-L-rhamnosidase [Dyadobacter sp. CECT 9275]